MVREMELLRLLFVVCCFCEREQQKAGGEGHASRKGHATMACHQSLPSITMTSTTLADYTLLDAPLPPPREGDALTASQWTTLLAIADTIIPSSFIFSSLTIY